MSVEFRTCRRVEWADTDQAGIVHFARFFVFMEAAEHTFWRSLGLSVHSQCDGDIISWPRLTAECEYFRPVSFEDVLDIHVHLEKQGEKSLSFRFRLPLRRRTNSPRSDQDRLLRLQSGRGYPRHPHPGLYHPQTGGARLD